MSTAGNPDNARILVVRLGAMGDIVHTLPAVASLKHSHPGSRLTWVVETALGAPARRKSASWTAWSRCAASPPRRCSRAGATALRTLPLRGGFPGPAEIRRWRPLPRAPAASSASTRAAARARRRSSIPARSAPARPTWWIATWTWRPRRRAASRRSCACSRCPPGVPKASCRRAISCSPRRWPAGAPSSGPWSITARWPRDWAPNWEFLW